MRNLTAKVRNFLRDEEGAETVEWVFVVALLILGVAVTWIALKDEVINILEAIIDELENIPG
jgi:Flp pilus assembly pilin Flp